MIEINLLPWREAKRKKQKKVTTVFYLLFFLIMMILLLAGHALFSYQSRIIGEQVRELKNKLYYLQNKTQIVNEKISLKKMTHEQFVTFDFLNQLFHLPVSGIQINELTQSNETMLINGHASSMICVSRFMSALLGIQKIHAVKLVSARRDAAGVVFQLQIVEFE